MARRLTRRRRERLASRIDSVFKDVRLGPRLTPAISPSWEGVEAAAPLLTQIEAMLRSEQPLYPQGTERLKRLLGDGGGPLYLPGQQEALIRECELIIEELGGKPDRPMTGPV